MTKRIRALLSLVLACLFVLPVIPAFAEEADPAQYLTKYESGIKLTVARPTNNSYKFIEGESFDSNIWTRSYLETLGITLEHAYVVDETQYDAKMNVVITSGDIPDIMKVSAKQAKMLAEAGMIHDMTEIFEEYASPASKKMLQSNAKLMEASLIDGRLMGIPVIWALDFQTPVLWIRSDWMQKLDLQEPKTAEDVLAIAEAFVTRDPDGNGMDDTYGIAIHKNLNGNVGDARGVFNMFHAYKDLWIKDAEGKLVSSSIQPEMKAALAKLHDLYARGILHAEFAVKDEGKVVEDIVSEKVGIEVGQFWNPAWPFLDLKRKNPDSDWLAYPLLPADGKEVALSQATAKVDTFFVVSKNCQNPEAIVKILNLDIENMYGAYADKWAEVTQSDTYKELQTHVYALLGFEPPSLNRDMYDQVQATLETGDESNLLMQISKNDYEDGMKWVQGGDVDGWDNYKIRFDKHGGMAMVKAIIEADNIKYNEFYGLPGPVAIERSSTMEKLTNEFFTKIIMGTVGVDEFDTFVSQWLQIGGEELTAEVNEWYASIQ